nr:hypothetical chloroplast RF19 [Avicennia marina]
MIFQSFLLGNLVSLCTKIINSVVVVGLYYGFLTTFSIGPSYLFLLRAEVMEEGTEKKVSARTGFITGQLVMFISIYYAPLHLALGRPHTITVLALPYLLFHFFWNNHKLFLNYGPATRNSMRNFSIQCVFLNNLIFQLFNHFILPSSMLARLVNISMFRCNNKMLFVTSSFVGWLIGHILFMKWLGLVLVWIRQNHSIRSNILIRSNKYLVSELRNSMAQIFSILLFITCVYYLGRIPSPILTKKLKETSKTETSLPKKRKETDPNKIDEREEIQVNGKKDEFYFPFTEADSKNRPVSKEFYLMNQNENDDNSKFKIFDKKTQDKHPIHFYKPFVILLFDSKRWNRPSRYIKNNKFDKAVRNEMSQYFFDICQSDGNPRISFTYLSSLSFFFEIIKRKISSAILKKFSSNELYNSWVFTNKQKGKSFNNEFINRIEALDKESIPLNMFQIRTQLCNDDFTKEYLSKSYDPVLNGSYRRRIYKSLSRSILIKNFNKKFWINRIHVMLLPYTDSNQKISRFDKKPLSREIFTFSIQFIREPASINLNRRGPSLFSFSEGRKYFQYFLNTTETDDNGKAIRIKEINKKVPRWADNLITELEQESGEHEEDIAVDHEIRSRKAKRVVIFTTNKEDTDPNTTDPNTTDQTNEVALIRYSHQPDFRRGIIKGSIRAQRRKIEIGELFQANVHSPLFFNKIQKFPLFSFDISEWIKLIFRNWVGKEKAFKILKYRRYEKQTKIKEQKETKKKKEKAQIDIAEYWDRIPFAQVIRGSMLLTQSIFRKSILLPSLIISKNIGRIFLLQFPEWSEDFKEWNREIHVKCTYNGVPLSETEFPKNWLTDGIQIKIFFPFCLKPWHKSKEESSPKDLIKNKKEKDDFSFLTILGMEAELPFGSPRKRPSFFKPILKELEKKLRKFKKKSFRVFVQVLIVFKRKTKLLQKVLKEIKEWVIKRVCFLKKIIKEFFKGLKGNLIRLFRIREVEIYKLSQIKIKEEKYSMINNQIIHESSRQIASPSLKNCLLTERKMKDRTHRTNTLRDQIERISKEKVTPRMNNLSPKKTSYSVKRFKKWKVLKRRNARLMCKLSFFVKFFIERIYTDPILFIINSVRMNTEFFLESTKKRLINPFTIMTENKEELIKQRKIQFCLFRLKKSHLIILVNEIHIFFMTYLTCHKHMYFTYFHNSQLVTRINEDLFFNIKESPFFLSLKERILLKHKEWFIRNWGIRNFRVMKEINGKTGEENIPNTIYLRSNGLDKYQKNGEMQFISVVELKRKMEADGIYMKKTNKLIPKNKKNLNEIHYLMKKRIFKNTIDMIFYHLNFLIMKIKRNAFVMDLRFKELRTKRFLIIHLKKPSLKCWGTSLLIIIEERSIFYIWKKQLTENILIGKFSIIILEKKSILRPGWRSIQIGIKIRKFVLIILKKFIKRSFYLMISEINSPNSPKGFFDWMGMNEKMLRCPISNLELWFFPEFVSLYNAYKTKPWFIPSKLLLNLNKNENSSENQKINEKGSFLIASNKKHRNQEEKEPTSRGDLGSVLSQQKDIDETDARSDMKKGKKKKQYKSKTEAELDLFLKRYLLFQLRWDDTLNQRMVINNIKVYCLLLRMIDPRKITISLIQQKEMSLDIMLIQKNLTLTELMKKGVLIIEPIRAPGKKDGQFIMYQTIGISLIHKNKHQTNQKYQEQGYVSKDNFDETISPHQRIIENRDKNHFYLLVPETILSFRRRRKLRILIYFISKTRNDVDRSPVFCNEKSVKNISQVSQDNNHLDREKNQLMKFKLFLWPNYRLEDLACMNRYWIDTNNGSRFSMLRIQMYPGLKIHE